LDGLVDVVVNMVVIDGVLKDLIAKLTNHLVKVWITIFYC
jgi:hypothetical protein